MTTPRDDAGSQDPGPRVNLFDPEVQRCPWEAYRTLRDEAPVHRIPGTDIFVVTRYEHVREVLTDPRRFPSSAKNELMRASPNDVERGRKVAERFKTKGWLPAPTLAGRDDPNHRQMRAMFNEAFKPSRIKEIDPRVESLAYELIDGFWTRANATG
jgi:cytochrome P450